MRNGGSVGGVLAALLLVLACSGKTDSGDTVPEGSGAVSADEFPARFAATICDPIGPCCMDAGFPYDAEVCRRRIEQQIAASIADELSEGPNVVYDPVEGGRCLDAYAAALVGCTVTDEDGVEGDCDEVFRGTLPEGSPCTSSVECAAPTNMSGSCELAQDGIMRCAVVSDSGPIAPLPGPGPGSRGVAGAGCSGTCTDEPVDVPCVGLASPPGGAACYTNDGLYCSPTTFVCTPLGNIGDACEASSQSCVEGAFCENGACAAQRTSGPCAAFSWACAESAYCDYLLDACTPRKPDGTPCEFDEECGGGTCDQSRLVCGPDSLASADICAGNL